MLGKLCDVADLAGTRTALLRKIEVIRNSSLDDEVALGSNGPEFRIIVEGELLDGSIRALLRPILLAELWARVRMVELDLALLGVSVE